MSQHQGMVLESTLVGRKGEKILPMGLGGSGQDLLAQVDREEVPGHKTFRHHVVKDRGGSSRGDAGVSQPQDAIEGAVVEEVPRLGLRQPKDLVVDLNVCDLGKETERRARFGCPNVLNPMGWGSWGTVPYFDGVIAQDTRHAASAIGNVDGLVGADEGGGFCWVEKLVVACGDGGRWSRSSLTPGAEDASPVPPHGPKSLGRDRAEPSSSPDPFKGSQGILGASPLAQWPEG